MQTNPTKYQTKDPKEMEKLENIRRSLSPQVTNGKGTKENLGIVDRMRADIAQQKNINNRVSLSFAEQVQYFYSSLKEKFLECTYLLQRAFGMLFFLIVKLVGLLINFMRIVLEYQPYADYLES